MAHPPASSPEDVPENVPPVFETSRLRLRDAHAYIAGRSEMRGVAA